MKHNGKHRLLHDLRACSDAIEWAEQFDTPEEAWRECHRGDWMLWLIGRLLSDRAPDERKPLSLAASECARLALDYVPDGEDRPLKAIEAVEAWARGDDGVSIDDVRAAASAAHVATAAAAEAAAATFYAAEATDAADASASAAHAAASAAFYAASAASASYSAAFYAAEAAAATDAAHAEVLARCANIVRCHYPTLPVADAARSER